jgi:hypothetical protein
LLAGALHVLLNAHIEEDTLSRPHG